MPAFALLLPALTAALSALPALIGLLNRMCDLVARLGTWTQSNSIEKWITQLESNIDALEKAKTPQEKLDAVQSLVGSIRNI